MTKLMGLNYNFKGFHNLSNRYKIFQNIPNKNPYKKMFQIDKII